MGFGNHYTHGTVNGYRSGLEERIGRELKAVGEDGYFEKNKIRYSVPASDHTYTPDFTLSNGIIIETKGRFLSKDRKKHLLVKAQHPEHNIRFVFVSPHSKISKGSNTTYADWCNKHMFQYAKGSIPQAWIDEPAP